MIIGDLPVFSKMWLSKSEFPSNVKKIPITSGPYTISDYSIGKYIIYERNKNYTLTLKSSHPTPATLYSLAWEGDYSNTFYKRV